MGYETYRSLREMPSYGPDWADDNAVAEWIGRVRSVAFFNGARHAEIDKAEAREIIKHIAAFLHLDSPVT